MRADHESNQMSELLKQISWASPWPLLLLGEDGAVLGASDEFIDAANRSEPHDTPMRSRVAHYLSVLRGSVPWLTPQQADSVRTLPSGALAYERLHLRRMPWGACLVVVDQTEQRQAQTADIQTARLAALGFIVAGVCHEVTNPLTSLHSIVQILRAEKQPSQQLLNKGLDNIAVNVKRILDISRRLLKFSRVSDEPRIRFPVDNAIEEALYVLRQDGLLRNIEVEHQGDLSALVLGDTGEVREVFLNLFVNAVQAMAGCGTLRITTRSFGLMTEVLVSDNGPGINAAAVARIFEPFFTTKACSHGTGLGLALSAEIVNEHGGSLALRHTSAQGALFCVTLPRDRP